MQHWRNTENETKNRKGKKVEKKIRNARNAARIKRSGKVWTNLLFNFWTDFTALGPVCNVISFWTLVLVKKSD